MYGACLFTLYMAICPDKAVSTNAIGNPSSDVKIVGTSAMVVDSILT